MATVRSCGALVTVLPKLSKLGCALAGSSEQAAMLLHLGAIEQLGAPRMSDLAAHLQITQSTMSRRLSELRLAGLVQFTADPDDGRSFHVELTGKGDSALRQRRSATTERLHERLEQWSDADVEELTNLLGRLSRTVQPVRRPTGHRTPPVPEREREESTPR